MKLYDIRDEEDLPAAIKWAYEIAHKYADSNETAEECADIFLQKYFEWRKWINSADVRVATARKKWLDLHERIRDLSQQRWMFLGCGLFFGILIKIFLI